MRWFLLIPASTVVVLVLVIAAQGIALSVTVGRTNWVLILVAAVDALVLVTMVAWLIRRCGARGAPPR